MKKKYISNLEEQEANKLNEPAISYEKYTGDELIKNKKKWEKHFIIIRQRVYRVKIYLWKLIKAK